MASSLLQNKCRSFAGLSYAPLLFWLLPLLHAPATLAFRFWWSLNRPPLLSLRDLVPTKKGNPKECSNYCTMALISHANKVMLKILQTRLQQYMNWELPDVQAGFRKGRGTSNQIANICWIIKKAREFQKNIYFCFIFYAKAFDFVDHNKLWKILKDMGIPDHLTWLLKPVCKSGSNS